MDLSSLSRFSHQSAVVLSLFRSLLLSRSLEVDTIIRAVVLPFASHWDGIFSRPVPRADKDHARSKISVEAPVLEHILDILSTLLEVTTKEVRDTLSQDQQVILANGSAASDEASRQGNRSPANVVASLDKSARHLTAVLRRALPALRVVSKWLIAHASYLARASDSPPAYPSPSSSSSSHSSSPASAIPAKIAHLWRTYAAFLNTMSVAFPFSDLPPLSDPLQEDVEMKGFGPIGKRMGEGWTGEQLILDRTEDGAGLHPNEEMLLRLWDLENDGRRIGSGEEGDGKAAVKLVDGRFIVGTSDEVIPRENGREKQKKSAQKLEARHAQVISVTTAPTLSASEKTTPAPSPPPPATAAAVQASRVATLRPSLASSRTPVQPVATPASAGRQIDRTRLVEQSPPIAPEAETDAEEAALNDGDSGSLTSALEHELELASVSTETEDDPVNRAMRAALDDDEDGDEFDDQHEAETLYQGERPVPDADEERIMWPVPTQRRNTVTAPSQ